MPFRSALGTAWRKSALEDHLDGSAMLAFLWLAAAAVGCGTSASAANGGADAGDVAAMCGPSAGEAGSGSGTIMGAPDAAPFTSVGTSLWIGSPDSDATIVVYLFSRVVGCGELCSPAWDQRIANDTQVLEMKLFGTAPATFTAVTTLTPAPGEASVNLTRSSTSGTPVEVSGSGGSVMLTVLEPHTSATGTFSLMFGAAAVSGTFNALYCPGGHEP